MWINQLSEQYTSDMAVLNLGYAFHVAPMPGLLKFFSHRLAPEPGNFELPRPVIRWVVMIACHDTCENATKSQKILSNYLHNHPPNMLNLDVQANGMCSSVAVITSF